MAKLGRIQTIALARSSTVENVVGSTPGSTTSPVIIVVVVGLEKNAKYRTVNIGAQL